MIVYRTHDGESNSVDDGLSELFVGAVTLVDDVIVTLRHQHVHRRRRHETTLTSHHQPALTAHLLVRSTFATHFYGSLHMLFND